MNRYSLIFALLMASSFAVHAPQSDEGSSPGASLRAESRGNVRKDKSKGKNGLRGPQKLQGRSSKHPGHPGDSSRSWLEDEPVNLIHEFLAKAAPKSDQPRNLHILYATVPHPVETHLAAEFDHNVDGLEDGLQDSGYLFDRSWIPWSSHEARDEFEDDEREKAAKEIEDETPGIMLFRKNQPRLEKNQPLLDPYANGIVVFLISEKPTEGMAVAQVDTAIQIMQQEAIIKNLGEKGISTSGPVRILGPTFTGSFASLAPMVRTLEKSGASTDVVIRGAGVTGVPAARSALAAIASEYPKAHIDFGSPRRNFLESVNASVRALHSIGIEEKDIALLKEDESGFGGLGHREPGLSGQLKGTSEMRVLTYPRDISVCARGMNGRESLMCRHPRSRGSGF